MGGNGKKEKKKPQGRSSVHEIQPGSSRYTGNASALSGGDGQSNENLRKEADQMSRSRGSVKDQHGSAEANAPAEVENILPEGGE